MRINLVDQQVVHLLLGKRTIFGEKKKFFLLKREKLIFEAEK